MYAYITVSGKKLECFGVFFKDEYQLCHAAVAEYLLNDCVYGNC